MTTFDIQDKLKELKQSIDELDEKHIGENADIRKINIKNRISKVNKRKNFYLRQQVDKTETSIVVLFSLYYVLLVGLIIVYITKKLYKSKTSIVIFVILAILPIVINTIVDSIVGVGKRIQNLIPNNEYKGLYKNELKTYLDLTNFDLNDIE